MHLLRFLSSKPRWVFLLDGCGALITGILLVYLLAPFERHFGMPVEVVRPLAYVAGGFAVYSLSCWALVPKVAARHHRVLLSIIALANSAYCVTTLAMVFAYRARITPLGVAYFVGESLIVGAIVALEFATAARARTVE